jgi:beta-N-acetylhexosaminidase
LSNQIRFNAGQTLVAGFNGQKPPRALVRAANQGELGGFILFASNIGTPREVLDLNRQLEALVLSAAHPPWITLDQEGGRVARLGPPVLKLPSMRQLGALGRPELTGEAALILGRQLKTLGFNLDLAPVLDVDTNPANPIIGDRSFSDDPEAVSAHGLAFIAGLQSVQVAACAKHFPGHGDTALDSHLTLPRVTHPFKRLETVELVPFRHVIEQVAAVMTAHVVYDAIDPRMPASLSRRVITGLLREGLGFRGVVVSDALEMKAISDHYGPQDAACLAIEAGCDALLLCEGPEQVEVAFEALVRRAERNAEFSGVLAQAAGRSLAMRKSLVRRGKGDEPPLDPASLEAESRAFELKLAALTSAIFKPS